MEFAPHGNLRDHLKSSKLDEYGSARVLDQVFQALRYLHCDKNIVHKDICPSNILITKLDPIETRVTDFNRSESVRDLSCRTGIRAYVAPEAQVKAALSPALDIWSLGIVIYQVHHGLDVALNECTSLEPDAWSLYLAERAKNEKSDARPLKFACERMIRLDPKARVSAKQGAEEFARIMKKLVKDSRGRETPKRKRAGAN
jgi:serine/threonine protein kinase